MAKLHVDSGYSRVLNDRQQLETSQSANRNMRRCTVAAGCSLAALAFAVVGASNLFKNHAGMVRHGTEHVIQDSSAETKAKLKAELAMLEDKLKGLEDKVSSPDAPATTEQDTGSADRIPRHTASTAENADLVASEDSARPRSTSTEAPVEPSASESTPREPKERQRKCSKKFVAPEKPKSVDQHNGVQLEDVCFDGSGPFHAFIIGDWGAIVNPDNGAIEAASHLSHRWGQAYKFVWPVDQQAQKMIADQMAKRAPSSKPDYVLNVGDNFYWAGVEDHCGVEDIADTYSGGGTALHKKKPVDQFKVLFEDMYTGPGLDDVPWLGVLGNHDYGGWRMDHAWDQAIGYTWSTKGSGRWMTPALYWRVLVRYPEFSVDYYFLDTNVWDGLDPKDQSSHNICGQAHNPSGASCRGGPKSVWDCQEWFKNLWEEEKAWLEDAMPKSTADWRIVVTHFPPYWGKHQWKALGEKLEIDLIVTGHRHSQFTRGVGDKPLLIWPEWGRKAALKEGYSDFMDPTAWVVSGGGGGVTSEHVPSAEGADDQYGYMDLTLAKDKLVVEAISHGGVLRHTMEVKPHYPHNRYWTKWDPTAHDTSTKRNTTKGDASDGKTGAALYRAAALKDKEEGDAAEPEEDWGDDWEPVGNRGDVACRGDADSVGEDGVAFHVHKDVDSLQKCQEICTYTSGCTGIEHGSGRAAHGSANGRCEVWIVPISASAELNGFTCLRYNPASKA